MGAPADERTPATTEIGPRWRQPVAIDREQTLLPLIAAGLVCWVAVGLIVAIWYDHKRMYRMMPDLLAHVEQAVDRRSRP
jgi:hypothetical protein